MTRKAQLLALAAAGGSAAVKAHGASLWPDSISINGNAYVLRGAPRPNTFRPDRIVGHYVWADRGVALTLADAQKAASQDNSRGLSR